ncbi:MAG TPA: ribonuclease T [Gammaproteobacteria bacterium]|nr:ribonuclease T [Gammaproteobacteria bacterium]
MAQRFRGFLPVIIDVETGGFNPETDALLEIAAVIPCLDETAGMRPELTVSTHVEPFQGANLDPKSLAITGIDPYNPLRAALPEQEALSHIFTPIRKAVKNSGCTRAILVGHNSAFDLAFLNAAVKRTGIKRNPFHPFSHFDTVSLGGLAFGQTVLGRALEAAGLTWNEKEAHSAVYDAERTAELFCMIVNRWDRQSRK